MLPDFELMLFRSSWNPPKRRNQELVSTTSSPATPATQSAGTVPDTVTAVVFFPALAMTLARAVFGVP
jgi:hypothetical protein